MHFLSEHVFILFVLSIIYFHLTRYASLFFNDGNNNNYHHRNKHVKTQSDPRDG